MFQLFNRLPATGAADPETRDALARWAPTLRLAGWIVGAIGVAGLVASAGGATPDAAIATLDELRGTLGTSADPSFVHAVEVARQGLADAKPVIERAISTPPWKEALAALGAILPGPFGSLLAAGCGIALHRFGASAPWQAQG